MTDEVVTPQETPVATPDAIATPQDGTATPAATPTPAPEKTLTQSQVDDLIQRRLARARRQWENESRPQPRPEAQQPAPVKKDEAPKREDFSSYEDYIDARTDHRARQIASEQIAERVREEANSRAQSEYQSVQRSHAGREDKARGTYEDYDDVAKDPTLPISQAMAAAIMHSDKGPDIAYYLGKNRADAERISKLPPVLALTELGKIEAKILAQPAPTREPSKAPAPINPLNGGNPPPAGPSDGDSTAEWMRKEAARVRKASR